MRIPKLVLWMLLVPFVLACSSDKDFEDPIPTPEPTPTPQFYPLSISVGENPLVEDAPASSNTGMFKAPITFLNTLKVFNLSYIYETGEGDDGVPYASGTTKEKPTNDGKGHWKNGDEGTIGWPNDASPGGDPTKRVTWYAYTDFRGDIVMSNYNKDPYLNFTVEEAVTDQKDLLIAKKTDTWNSCKGVMFFGFDHACSAIKFFMKKATNISSHTIVVKDVKLYNIKNTGCYYLERETPWDNVAFTSTSFPYSVFTLYDSEIRNGFDLTGTYQPLHSGALDEDDEDDYLFMIPQEVSHWNPSSEVATNTSGSFLKIVFTIDGEEKTGYVPFSGTFVMGHKHYVYINLGKNSLRNANGGLIIQ